MSMTASLGLMAVFAVDLVDMIFISMLGIDELAAAVGYAGAILFFTTSFNIGVAIAAGALVARALGEGDFEKARQRASSALIAGTMVSAMFACAVWLYLDFLVTMIGATGQTHELAVHYLSIIVPTLPFLLLGMAGGAILRAHGDASRAMMSTIIGGLVNAVLDPILIFGLDLELTGAALASAAARITIAVFALVPIFKYHGGLSRPQLTGFLRDLMPITAIALPAILTQLATPTGQAFVTRMMATHGEDAVAGLAIVGRLTPVAFGTLFALSGAVGPIIGQNYGANRFDRVREAVRASLLFTAAIVASVAFVLFMLRAPIAALFDATGISLTLIYLFCGPIALTFFFNGALFVSNACFNNLGHPFYSTGLNWGRHTVGTIPFVLVGSAWFGAPGILIGQAIGGVLFGTLAVLLVRRVMTDVEDSGSPPKAPGLFQRQARQVILSFARR
ncbi:MAG: MATE family efflux transporter [Paracoccaceae bacterium]